MLATLNIITNPFHPNVDLVQKPMRRKLKVSTIIQKYGVDLSRPTICRFNGQPISRSEWKHTVIADGDVVDFIALPLGGGGGSSPLRIVLSIAVMAFASWAAPQLAGAMGVSSAFGTALIKAGIGLLGNMLVNALIPAPKVPSARSSVATEASSGSPTYSINAQGNQARIGQPIPVVYGRHKIYPDFCAQPYVEYQDNDQYLYQLFCIGQGHFAVNDSDIYLEGTPATNLGAEVEIIPPGSKPTLFPYNVINSQEVSGQELVSGWSAEFVLNAAGTTINKVAYDVVFPRGLFYVNDAGTNESRSVSFQFRARQVNDAGYGTGYVWTSDVVTVTSSSSAAIRKTYKYSLPAGRYAISVNRITAKDESTRAASDMNWGAARGYLVGQGVDVGNVTLLAMKIKAGQNVSQASSRKVNLIARRKLSVPSYDSVTKQYVWSAPVETRSIAWAIADMCKNKDYGAGVSEARFNVGQLIALHSIWEARGDRLDGVFDSTETFWNALTMACRSGRARPYIQSGMIHFVRDQEQTIPTALFSSRNIVKGSFKITYVMKSEETADCVDVEYFDEVYWKQRTIRCSLEGSTSNTPARVQLFGVTNRDHAWREGMYSAGCNRYRRKEITFETELEGHIPSLGALVAIQSDIPEWGSVADVLSCSGKDVVVNEDMDWTDGVTNYALLRRADGSAFGPVVATRGIDNRHFTLASAPDFEVSSDLSMVRTQMVLGRAGAIQLARILSIKPRTNTVQISCINEDVRVHYADSTSSPPADGLAWSLPIVSVRPTVSGLTVTQSGYGVTPTIYASWNAAPGAYRYVLEASIDGGETWQVVSETTMTSCTFTMAIGNWMFRAAALGAQMGPYTASVSMNVGMVAPPADVTGLTVSCNGSSFNASWDAISSVDGYVVEVYAGGALKRSVEQQATQYSYSWDKAQADGGPWRTVTFKVKAKRSSTLSANWASKSATNQAPAKPVVSVTPGAGNLAVSVSSCSDADYVGTLIYGSTDPSFTPSEASLISRAPATFTIVQNVTQEMYFVAAHYDAYGEDGLNLSDKVSATPGSATAGMTTVTVLPADPSEVGGQLAIYLDVANEALRGIYGWDGSAWVRVGGLTDGSVTASNLSLKVHLIF